MFTATIEFRGAARPFDPEQKQCQPNMPWIIQNKQKGYIRDIFYVMLLAFTIANKRGNEFWAER